MLDRMFREPKRVIARTASSPVFSAGEHDVFGFVSKDRGAQGLSIILKSGDLSSNPDSQSGQVCQTSVP